MSLLIQCAHNSYYVKLGMGSRQGMGRRWWRIGQQPSTGPLRNGIARTFRNDGCQGRRIVGVSLVHPYKGYPLAHVRDIPYNGYPVCAYPYTLPSTSSCSGQPSTSSRGLGLHRRFNNRRIVALCNYCVTQLFNTCWLVVSCTYLCCR